VEIRLAMFARDYRVRGIASTPISSVPGRSTPADRSSWLRWWIARLRGL